MSSSHSASCVNNEPRNVKLSTFSTDVPFIVILLMISCVSMIFVLSILISTPYFWLARSNWSTNSCRSDCDVAIRTMSSAYTDEDRIKTFEIKTFRRILRVTWTDKRTNDWVLRKAGTEPFLLQSVKKRKLSYYGHLLRKEGNYGERNNARSSGQRRGRPRTRWQDNITKWTGLTGDRLLRSVEDRSQWRKTIHEAANARFEDSWRYKL